MMMNKLALILEMTLLFGVVPVSLALPIPLWLKLGMVVVALGYSIYLSRQLNLFTRHALIAIPTTPFIRTIVLRFILFAALSAVAMALLYQERFFYVVINKPLLWLGISLFYSVFSVYPQEFLYRTLFFKRYQTLFASSKVLILVNAAIFSLAHTMFANALVFVLTFFGGLIFAVTYLRTHSLMLVSIEHSAYGLWLYTIGMGNMLAFPG